MRVEAAGVEAEVDVPVDMNLSNVLDIGPECVTPGV